MNFSYCYFGVNVVENVFIIQRKNTKRTDNVPADLPCSIIEVLYAYYRDIAPIKDSFIHILMFLSVKFIPVQQSICVLIFQQVSQGPLVVCKGTLREVRTKYEDKHLESNKKVDLQGKRTQEPDNFFLNDKKDVLLIKS